MTFTLLLAVCTDASAELPTHDELFEFVPSEVHQGANLGYSVAVADNTGIAGAFRQESEGRAYLFDLATGQLQHTLQHHQPTNNDGFGLSVAMRGQFAVVGAPWDRIQNHQPLLSTGSATVFNRTTGQQTAFIWPADAGSEDQFGAAVAVGGGLVIVGAPGDDDAGSNSGSIYGFNVLTGAFHWKLTASDAGPNAQFGSSIAVSGSTLVVGAPTEDENGSSSGAAYLFDLTTLTETMKLLPDDGAPNSDFGTSVAIDGDLVLVGAPRAGISGAGYLFHAGSGLQLHRLTACDGTFGSTFGRSVGLSGTTAVVGANFHVTTETSTLTGAVDFYDTTTGAQRFRLLPADANHLDNFGVSVGIGATRVVVGAYRMDSQGTDSGSTYVFDAAQVDNSGFGYCDANGPGTNCPCGIPGNSGEGCMNSGGLGGARLTGEGDASMTSDTFRLSVQGVPGNKPGLIFRGSSQSGGGLGVPAGDGLLCTTGQSARSQVQVTSGGSTVFTDFNGSPFGASSLGICVETNYQFWYRDPQGSCTGAGFNFSGAWTTTWLP